MELLLVGVGVVAGDVAADRDGLASLPILGWELISSSRSGRFIPRGLHTSPNPTTTNMQTHLANTRLWVLGSLEPSEALKLQPGACGLDLLRRLDSAQVLLLQKRLKPLGTAAEREVRLRSAVPLKSDSLPHGPSQSETWQSQLEALCYSRPMDYVKHDCIDGLTLCGKLNPRPSFNPRPLSSSRGNVPDAQILT